MQVERDACGRGAQVDRQQPRPVRARAWPAQHDAADRGDEQQRACHTHDVGAGFAQQHVAMQFVDRLHRMGRSERQRFGRARAQQRAADRIEHRLDARIADTTLRQAAQQQPVDLPLGLRQTDALHMPEAARALDDGFGRQPRTAAGGGQQLRVEPGVQWLLVDEDGAGQSDQRKPQAQHDAEPAVHAEPTPFGLHAVMSAEGMAAIYTAPTRA